MRCSIIRYTFLVVILSLNSCGNKNQSKGKIADENLILKTDSIKHLFPKFKVNEYCDRKDQDSVYADMNKFGKRKPYNLNIKAQENRLIIQYKIIDDCCLKFKGKASKNDNKLNLFHLNRSKEVCECNCMYEFEFVFTKIKDIPENIYINEQKI